MNSLSRFLLVFVCTSALTSALGQGPNGNYPMSPKIMQAKSAIIMCECPRGLAVAESKALSELLRWGRFQIVQRRQQSDLVILFSGNEYLGDLLTRDGPDPRPVSVDFTIMTVIDAKTGAALWADSRRWGSWRVEGATKDLITELKEQIEDQTRKWTLDDLQLCAVTPLYAGFKFKQPEEALANRNFEVTRVPGSPDRLQLSSPVAPNFCRQIQLVIGPDNTIVAFEVIATPADTMDISEILRYADNFRFTGDKDVGSDQPYFVAESKDRKLLIRYEIQGHRVVLTRVRFSYQ